MQNVHLLECVTRSWWCIKNPLKWSDDDDATLNYVPLIVSGIFPLSNYKIHFIITTKKILITSFCEVVTKDFKFLASMGNWTELRRRHYRKALKIDIRHPDNKNLFTFTQPIKVKNHHSVNKDLCLCASYCLPQSPMTFSLLLGSVENFVVI